MKILFLLSYLVFFIGLTIFKKNNKKLNFIKTIILEIIFTIVLNVMLMTVLFIFGVGFTPLFVSSVLGITGITLVILTIKNKAVQKYKFEWSDFIIAATICLAGLLVSAKLFGLGLHIAYNNVDPAAHFYMAQNNLVNHEHSGMFFNEVNNALAIYGLSAFTESPFFNFKLYILMDIFMFILSGLVFYALVSDFSKKTSDRFICGIIAIAYMLGYSLNNMIFGFGYLGTSVTLICFTLIICKAFWEEKISLALFIPLASMCALSLVLCYMLFAPVIWVLLTIFIYCYCRKRKLKFKKFALIELSVFLIPFILAIKFCYFDFFLSNNLNMSDQLRMPGGAYENYFTNFIIFAPIILYAVIKNIQKKEAFTTTLFMLGWLVFVVILLIMKQFEAISAYYCLKAYYVMWLLALVVFSDGIIKVKTRYPKIIYAYYGIIIALFFGSLITKNGKLFDVYTFNYIWLTHRDMLKLNPETIDGYQYATEEIIGNGERITWLTNLSQYHRVYWFNAIQALNTNDYSYYRAWDYSDQDDLLEDLKKEDIKYIGIYKFAPDSYAPYEKIIKNSKPTYENSEIGIYELVK